jgi:hypothetical protein
MDNPKGLLGIQHSIAQFSLMHVPDMESNTANHLSIQLDKSHVALPACGQETSLNTHHRFIQQS